MSIHLNEEDRANPEQLEKGRMKSTDPWRATITSFRNEALFRQYIEALRVRRRDLAPDEVQLLDRITLAEEIEMTARSTVPDPIPPAPPEDTRTTELRPSSPSPSIAGDREPGDRRPDVDPDTGRIRPISDAEWQARQAELTRRLAEIDAEDDTPDEVYDQFMRNLDEGRRLQGRPPAFEGCN